MATQMTIRPEDLVPFLDHLVAERNGQADQAGPDSSEAIRVEHGGRVEAADQLLAAVRDHEPGQPLTLEADDLVGLFMLSMATDRMLADVTDRVGKTCRYDVADYDGIDAAIQRASEWVEVARTLDLSYAHATAAELVATTEGSH